LKPPTRPEPFIAATPACGPIGTIGRATGPENKIRLRGFRDRFAERHLRYVCNLRFQVK
jgi:hypothetical protein